STQKTTAGKGSWRGWWTHLRLTLVERYDKQYRSVRTVLPAMIRDIHVPTLISFTLITAIIGAFFLAARWPIIGWVFPPPLSAWWVDLRADLDASPNSKNGELIVGAFT